MSNYAPMILSFAHVYFIYTTTALSVIANSTLIFLICKHNSPKLGRYKWLMLTFSIFNIFYTLVHAVTMPVIHVYDLSFFVFASNMLDTSIIVTRITTAIFCSTFAQSLFLVSLHFVYRYTQVVLPRGRFIFERSSCLIALTTLYLVVALDYGSVNFFNFGPSQEKDTYFGRPMHSSYGLNISQVGYLGPTYHVHGNVKWFDLLGVLNVGIVNGLTFAVISFCGLAIAKRLRVQKVLSERTKELQVQMFKMLLIQSIFPLAFTFIPSSAILVMTFIGESRGEGGNIVALLLNLHPVIDPIVVIYLVTSYREAVLNYFRPLRFAAKCILYNLAS